MNILVANIGSTSLKYRLFDFTSGEGVAVAKGGFERVTDYGSAIQSLLQELRDGGHLADGQKLDAVGFKTVVADEVTGVVELDDTVLAAMERLNDLAPAHNPPYIQGVRVFREAMPETPEWRAQRARDIKRCEDIAGSWLAFTMTAAGKRAGPRPVAARAAIRAA